MSPAPASPAIPVPTAEPAPAMHAARPAPRRPIARPECANRNSIIDILLLIFSYIVIFCAYFKGLERPAAILVELAEVLEALKPQIVYIAAKEVKGKV